MDILNIVESLKEKLNNKEYKDLLEKTKILYDKQTKIYEIRIMEVQIHYGNIDIYDTPCECNKKLHLFNKQICRTYKVSLKKDEYERLIELKDRPDKSFISIHMLEHKYRNDWIGSHICMDAHKKIRCNVRICNDCESSDCDCSDCMNTIQVDCPKLYSVVSVEEADLD
jgi:hypothetical protein